MYLSSVKSGTEFQRFTNDWNLGILVLGYTVPKAMKVPIDEGARYKPSP